MALDPVTLSVIQAGLQQVCDEMDLTFSRAAFSPVIAEANDRSDGIYSAEDGSLIAQGAGGLPVFVGTMQYSTRTLIADVASCSSSIVSSSSPREKAVPILSKNLDVACNVQIAHTLRRFHGGADMTSFANCNASRRSGASSPRPTSPTCLPSYLRNSASLDTHCTLTLTEIA